MKMYTVSLCMSVEAENEKEAMELAQEKLDAHDFDSDSIEIEEEIKN